MIKTFPRLGAPYNCRTFPLPRVVENLQEVSEARRPSSRAYLPWFPCIFLFGSPRLSMSPSAAATSQLAQGKSEIVRQTPWVRFWLTLIPSSSNRRTQSDYVITATSQELQGSFVVGMTVYLYCMHLFSAVEWSTMCPLYAEHLLLG